MSILQDLIRVVVRIGDEGNPGAPLISSPRADDRADSIFPHELLGDFFNQDHFPDVAMDDAVWMPERSISSVWGNHDDWRNLL